MAKFSYSEEKTESLYSNNFINESGFYVGELIEAYGDISKGGANYIRFTFRCPVGIANFDIYYTNRDGKRTFGADIIAGGLLKVLGLKEISSQKGTVEVYNFETKQNEAVEKQIYRDILFKPLGVILQKVYFAKQNGDESYKFNLLHFTDTTGRTAIEMQNGNEPKMFKRKIIDMWDYRVDGMDSIPYEEYKKAMKKYDPAYQGFNEAKTFGTPQDEEDEEELPF